MGSVRGRAEGCQPFSGPILGRQHRRVGAGRGCHRRRTPDARPGPMGRQPSPPQPGPRNPRAPPAPAAATGCRDGDMRRGANPSIGRRGAFGDQGLTGANPSLGRPVVSRCRRHIDRSRLPLCDGRVGHLLRRRDHGGGSGHPTTTCWLAAWPAAGSRPCAWFPSAARASACADARPAAAAATPAAAPPARTRSAAPRDSRSSAAPPVCVRPS